MDKDQIIKYAAIAAGAYLIYTFMRDAGYLDGLFDGCLLYTSPSPRDV
jgi:hypothetical protein